MTQDKAPLIRFSGFNDAWEQRKLGELTPLRGGFAFKSTEFVENGIPIVRISNILPNGNVNGEFVFYQEQKNDNNFLIPNDAAIIAMSGATAGKVAILKNSRGKKYYQNQRVGYFVKTNKVSYEFISTLVRSELFLNNLSSVLVAGAQPNISSKDIDLFEFLIPKTIEEQKKIGAFFKSIDDTITLHQRKYDLLISMKQSYLGKLFPKNGEDVPEIRFVPFTDVWEQRKLGDLVKINGRIGFRGYTQSDIITKEEGGVLTFSPTNIVNNSLTLDVNNTYITKVKYEESPEIMVQNGNILFVKTGSTLGKSALIQELKEDATINPQIVVLTTSEKSKKIISTLLTSNQVQKQVAKAKIGGAVPTLTETEIKKFEIYLPKEDNEKVELGTFFQKLDDTIALHQTQIEQLKNIKKSLLNKMFI